MKFALNDEAKKFQRFSVDNFVILFYFLQKLYLSAFVDLEKFQPW